MPANNQSASVTQLYGSYQQTANSEEPAAVLKSGGGGGTSDGMERLIALEKRFDRFETKLDAIVKDVSEIKGRTSAMPSTWQLLGMILSIVIGVMGSTFAILRLAGLIAGHPGP